MPADCTKPSRGVGQPTRHHSSEPHRIYQYRSYPGAYRDWLAAASALLPDSTPPHRERSLRTIHINERNRHSCLQGHTYSSMERVVLSCPETACVVPGARNGGDLLHIYFDLLFMLELVGKPLDRIDELQRLLDPRASSHRQSAGCCPQNPGCILLAQ